MTCLWIIQRFVVIIDTLKKTWIFFLGIPYRYISAHVSWVLLEYVLLRQFFFCWGFRFYSCHFSFCLTRYLVSGYLLSCCQWSLTSSWSLQTWHLSTVCHSILCCLWNSMRKLSFQDWVSFFFSTLNHLFHGLGALSFVLPTSLIYSLLFFHIGNSRKT